MRNQKNSIPPESDELTMAELGALLFCLDEKAMIARYYQAGHPMEEGEYNYSDVLHGIQVKLVSRLREDWKIGITKAFPHVAHLFVDDAELEYVELNGQTPSASSAR